MWISMIFLVPRCNSGEKAVPMFFFVRAFRLSFRLRLVKEFWYLTMHTFELCDGSFHLGAFHLLCFSRMCFSYSSFVAKVILHTAHSNFFLSDGLFSCKLVHFSIVSLFPFIILHTFLPDFLPDSIY